MSIVQRQGDAFQIVLPPQPTSEQKALKAKIDGLLETLEQVRSHPLHPIWVEQLEAIAKGGFDENNADPARAISLVGALAVAVARQSASRQGAFIVRLPDPSEDDDKDIG